MAYNSNVEVVVESLVNSSSSHSENESGSCCQHFPGAKEILFAGNVSSRNFVGISTNISNLTNLACAELATLEAG